MVFVVQTDHQIECFVVVLILFLGEGVWGGGGGDNIFSVN